MTRPLLKDLRDNASDKEWHDAIRDFASRFVFDTFSWDPGSVPASSVLETTLSSASYPSLKGLRTTMVVTVTAPADLNSGLEVQRAWCGTDDTLTIRLKNTTGGDLDQGEGTWRFDGRLP